MKKKSNKIVLIILILLIISGIIILGVKGFNKSPEYMAGTKIEVYIEKGYNKDDIVNIAKECFTNKDIYFEDAFNWMMSDYEQIVFDVLRWKIRMWYVT